GHGFAHPLPLRDEQGIDEVIRRKRRLPHHAAQGGTGAQTARPYRGEGHDSSVLSNLAPGFPQGTQCQGVEKQSSGQKKQTSAEPWRAGKRRVPNGQIASGDNGEAGAAAAATDCRKKILALPGGGWSGYRNPNKPPHIQELSPHAGNDA